MKGPAVDRRLEAIAGVPRLFTTPTAAIPNVQAMIFVGLFQYAPGKQDDRQVALGPSRVYVSGHTGLLGGSSVYRHTPLTGDVGEGGLVVAVAPDGSQVGRSSWEGQEWVGPFIGAVYDRPLTDYQIRRVIEHLKWELQN